MAGQNAVAKSVDILIAEDDNPLREELRLVLEAHGYACATAGNGRAAIELARDLRPQCVLLDIGMPELDGFAVARRLRSDPDTRTAHIDCLTGHTDVAYREKARRAGCEVFLTKPVDVAGLLAVIDRQVVRDSAEWVSNLTKTEAEEWLDWLEAHGSSGKLSFQGAKGFAVRATRFEPNRSDSRNAD